jgi:repressor LexA
VAPELTPRQAEILAFIRGTVRQKGYPPSIWEINQHFGFTSPGSARDHLKALERKGYLTRVKGRSRGLELTESSPYPAAIEVPLVGAAPAGQPLLAIENVEETLPLPKGLFASGDFALRVKGESMVEAGILDGDIVVVRRQDTAENGDIVVALIGEEATVKRFYRDNGRVRLQPANARMQPLLLDPAEVAIQGKVIGVMRRLPAE